MIKTKYPLVLASSSPRRRQLLEQITEEYTCVNTRADESSITEADPRKLVASLSLLKTTWAAENSEKPVTIIGADTIVCFQGQVLGKPKSSISAFEMLKSLQGRTHRVLTGVTVLESATGKSVTKVEETEVIFSEISDKELWEYVDTGDCMDKAGAYGIQGRFARHIVGIRGCYFNVMGLPLHLLYSILKDF